MRNRPMLLAAIAGLAGAFVGDAHWTAVLAAIALALAARRARLALPCGLLCVAAFVACRAGAQQRDAGLRRDALARLGRSPTPPVLTGYIEEGPYEETDSSWFILSRARPAGDFDGPLLRFRVRSYGRAPPVGMGDWVRVGGRPRVPGPPTNAGQTDSRRWAFVHGLDGYVGAEWVRTSHGPPGPGRAIARIRGWLHGRMRAHAPADAAEFAAALLLGLRGGLDEDLQRALQETGTAHILAISGLHVVLLAGLLLHAGFSARLRRRRLVAFALAGVWVFTVLAGLQPPVTRCAVVMTVYALARLTGRGREPWNALGAAATLLLACDPSCAFDAGFQLSFAGVAGILLLARPIAAAARAPAGVAVSVGAWCATAPIAARLFHRVTPVVVAANVVLMPFVSWCMAWAILLPLTPWAGPPMEWGTAGMRWTATLLAATPGASAWIPDRPAWVLLLYYAALGAWALRLRRSPSTRSALAGALLPAILALTPPRAPTSRMTVLDVGHGTCVVVEGPDGAVVVYDCGSQGWRDPGASILARALWARGISRVDALVLSHTDRDHVNGAATAIELFRPRVYVSEYFDLPLPADPVVVRSPTPLTPWATAIPPPPWRALRGGAPSTNDASVGLIVRLGGVTVWLPGDAQDREAEAWLMEDEFPDADIVMAPHHGRWFDEAERFAEACGARVVLVSGDAAHRSRKTERTWIGRGAQIRRTSDEGAIAIEFSGP